MGEYDKNDKDRKYGKKMDRKVENMKVWKYRGKKTERYSQRQKNGCKR